MSKFNVQKDLEKKLEEDIERFEEQENEKLMVDLSIKERLTRRLKTQFIPIPIGEDEFGKIEINVNPLSKTEKIKALGLLEKAGKFTEGEGKMSEKYERLLNNIIGFIEPRILPGQGIDKEFLDKVVFDHQDHIKEGGPIWYMHER